MYLRRLANGNTDNETASFTEGDRREAWRGARLHSPIQGTVHSSGARALEQMGVIGATHWLLQGTKASKHVTGPIFAVYETKNHDWDKELGLTRGGVGTQCPGRQSRTDTEN